VTEVRWTLEGGHVGLVELDAPPNNFLTTAIAASIADAYEALDADPACRVIVLCSKGRHFCAGVDFGEGIDFAAEPLYREGLRLFATGTPVVAAVQGAAVGGGLGLALSADFRVVGPRTRMTVNFARLGFHHGFGISETLPAVVGGQRALELLYTGRRVPGPEAVELGMADRLAAEGEERAGALALAAEIAASAPLALRSIRATMRGDLHARIRAATDRESVEQRRLMGTADFAEGVAAYAERRGPEFTGR
jgi:enoyl-CoA hydratase/carnithine racemase